MITQKSPAVSAQHTVGSLLGQIPAVPEELRRKIAELLHVDVVALYNKSPCDDTNGPNKKSDCPAAARKCASNLTVSCCRRCAGKEIKLV